MFTTWCMRNRASLAVGLLIKLQHGCTRFVTVIIYLCFEIELTESILRI